MKNKEMANTFGDYNNQPLLKKCFISILACLLFTGITPSKASSISNYESSSRTLEFSTLDYNTTHQLTKKINDELVQIQINSEHNSSSQSTIDDQSNIPTGCNDVEAILRKDHFRRMYAPDMFREDGYYTYGSTDSTPLTGFMAVMTGLMLIFLLGFYSWKYYSERRMWHDDCSHCEDC